MQVPDTTADPPTLPSLLRSSWLVLSIGVLLGVLAGALHVSVTPKTYRATTQLLVTPTSPSTDATAAYDANLLGQRLSTSYASLMQSPQFAELVVRDLHLDVDASQLAASLNIVRVADTNLISASVDMHQPGAAQRTANALAPLFATYMASLSGDQPGPSSPAAVTVAASAVLPTQPVSPQPARELTVTGFAGLLIALAVAAGRRRRTTLAQEVIRFEERSAVPVLAVFPDARAQAVQGVRELRTNLMHELGAEPARPVVLVGVRDAHGTAASLAEALAQSLADIDEQVLLVHGAGTDAGQSGRGLVDIVRSGWPLAEAVRRGLPQRADVLDWGEPVDDPSDLLALSGMATLLGDARRVYDQVLVWCRPADSSSDGLSVAAHDVRILLVAVGRDLATGQVDATLRRFFRTGAAVTGVVVLPRPMRSSSASGLAAQVERHEPTLR